MTFFNDTRIIPVEFLDKEVEVTYSYIHGQRITARGVLLFSSAASVVLKQYRTENGKTKVMSAYTIWANDIISWKGIAK